MKKRCCIVVLMMVLAACCGCSVPMEAIKRFFLNPSFDGDVKLLKDDITIEKTDYMKYGPDEIEYQNYEISIPYEVDGTVEEDITDIQVRYDFDINECEAVTDMALHSEMDAAYKVMESAFTLEKGAEKGCLKLKTDYNAMCMLDEPDTYPYIWISIQLDDEDNTNDYVLIYNPYFCGEFPSAEMADFSPKIMTGDVWIDKDNVTIEKGDMEDDVQHYILSIPVETDGTEEMCDTGINVGADFVFAAVNGDDDASEGILGAIWFQEGVTFGFKQSVMIDEPGKKYIVKMDVYNRFAGDATGYDIDYYPYFWVAIGARDSNTNNNYYILKNPFFDDNNPYCLDEVKNEHGYDTQWNIRIGILKLDE